MGSDTFSRGAFRAFDEFLESSVASGLIPGAVAAVGRASGILYHRAVGRRAIRPRAEPMTLRTIFDLASLTKVLVTAPLVVEAAMRSEYSLLDPLERHLSETKGTEVGALPLRLLLTHTAGLVPDNPLEDYRGSKRALYAAIAHEPLASPPGTRSVYSDVGFVLLQGVLERRARRSLARLAEMKIFRPLRFRDTRFGVRARDRGRTAPTEAWRGRWLPGTVHDPRARAAALRGVAGHAGVFGTASETARYCQMILSRGDTPGGRVLLEETVRAMTTNQCDESLGVRRGFGFDIESPYSSPRGALFSRNSFGHSGWTGVSLWIDPDADGYLVLLSNAVHPDGHKDLKSFRAEAGTLAARALLGG
jgi:CubicO group peptidase (beta-lactamase class C family)